MSTLTVRQWIADYVHRVFLSDREVNCCQRLTGLTRSDTVRQSQTVISYKSYCGALQILVVLISVLMAS